MDDVGKILGEQLLKVVTIAEEEIDRQIEKYDRCDENELEVIRQKRIEEMKKRQQQKQEITDERAFFDASKKSNKIICHFYLPTNERCKIVDKHLRHLAVKYLDVRFICANAEKFPFLTERLKIRFIPTIAVIIDTKTVDYIRGFDDLGRTDEFRTETLEWRLARSGVLQYDGPSYLPGSSSSITKMPRRVKKKAIRGRDADKSDDDDDDW